MEAELGLFFLIVGTLLELIFTIVVVTAISIIVGLVYKSLTLMKVALQWSLIGGFLGIIAKALWILMNFMSLKEALNSSEVALIVPNFTGLGGILGIFYWLLRVKNRD